MFASGKTCCVYSNDARPFAQRVLDVDASMGSQEPWPWTRFAEADGRAAPHPSY